MTLKSLFLSFPVFSCINDTLIINDCCVNKIEWAPEDDIIVILSKHENKL